VLSNFGGGEGVIGIHGTNAPGKLGSNVSHGCVRVSNDVILRLSKTLPLGTPVEIIARGAKLSNGPRPTTNWLRSIDPDNVVDEVIAPGPSASVLGVSADVASEGTPASAGVPAAGGSSQVVVPLVASSAAQTSATTTAPVTTTTEDPASTTTTLPVLDPFAPVSK
jgi:L,D-transpeptidase catalytic domain